MQYGNTFQDRLDKLMYDMDFLPIPKTETLRQLAEKKEKRKQLSGADIAKIANTSTTSVNYWINKKSLPQMECLKLLSDAFGVSVEWLLAQTDSRNLEFKTGFGAFEELGFSAKAYENLKRLKGQGQDMEKLMEGINQLLEYATQPHSDLSDEIEEYKKQAEIEDTEDEKKYLLDAADELDQYVAEIQLPALEHLNAFFDLYPNGVYTHVPLRNVMKLGFMDDGEVTADSKEYHNLRKGLFTTMPPGQSDGAALFAFENTLKEIKKRLIVKAVEDKSRGVKYFDEAYMPTFKGATYGYYQSQEYALELLCDFYALDIDTSKMRGK